MAQESIQLTQDSAWRYIDCVKFVDLLQTSELHFTRLDHLRDPYEIALSNAAFRRLKKVAAIQKQPRYVNCWHLNDVESAAMWSLYGDNGIAILSNTHALRQIDLTPTQHNDDAGFGMKGFGTVEYKASEDLKPLLRNIQSNSSSWDDFVFTKRASFAHEKEFRLALGLSATIKNPPAGLRVKVDLNVLVDAVYVSPTAQKWTVQVIERELTRYGLKKPTIHSQLYTSRLR
jgi:hypothetical protein